MSSSYLLHSCINAQKLVNHRTCATVSLCCVICSCLTALGDSNGHEVDEEEDGAQEGSDSGASLELRIVLEDVSKC